MTEDIRPTLPGVIAYLGMADAKAAVALYEKAFGAKIIMQMPTPDGRLMHCQLEINGGAFMLSDAFPEHGYPHVPLQGFVLHISSPDPKAVWKRGVDAGLQVSMPLEIAFWGDYYGQLTDEFGVKWGIVGPTDEAPKAV